MAGDTQQPTHSNHPVQCHYCRSPLLLRSVGRGRRKELFCRSSIVLLSVELNLLLLQINFAPSRDAAQPSPGTPRGDLFPIISNFHHCISDDDDDRAISSTIYKLLKSVHRNFSLPPSALVELSLLINIRVVCPTAAPVGVVVVVGGCGVETGKLKSERPMICCCVDC